MGGSMALSPVETFSISVKKRQHSRTTQEDASSKRVRSGEHRPKLLLRRLETRYSHAHAEQPAQSALASQSTVPSAFIPDEYVGEIFGVPSLSEVPLDDPIRSHPDFGTTEAAYEHPCIVVSNANAKGEVLCFPITSFSQHKGLMAKYPDKADGRSLSHCRRRWREIEVPGCKYAVNQNGVRVAHDDTPVLELASNKMKSRSYVRIERVFSTKLSTLKARSGAARLTLEAVNVALSEHNLYFSGKTSGAAAWTGIGGSSIDRRALPLVDITTSTKQQAPRKIGADTGRRSASPPSSPGSPTGQQALRKDLSVDWRTARPQTPPSSSPMSGNGRYQSSSPRNVRELSSWR